MLLFPAAAIAEHHHLIAIAIVLKDSPLSAPAPAREHWPGRSWRCHGLKRRAKIGNMNMSDRHGSSASCAGARPLGAGGAPGEEQHEGQEEGDFVFNFSKKQPLSVLKQEERNFSQENLMAPISIGIERQFFSVLFP